VRGLTRACLPGLASAAARGLPGVCLLALATGVGATEHRVADDAELRQVCRQLEPGDVVLLGPGEYRGGLSLVDLAGSPERPVTLAGADPERPPVFVGGSQALHLIRPRHVVLRDLVVRGQRGNGINVDEGGPGQGRAAHVTVERVRFVKIGPRGNHDALKLSGLTDFAVRDCAFLGWGGSAIDMVGCQRGVIQGCTFRGQEDCSQHSGVQAKGGTSEVVIRACRFTDAGQRALNLGGSTGLEWFRPQGARYEARALTVEGCRFAGSQAPVAFVGVDGAVVRHNTFYRPRRWVLRILQESQGERFVPCRNGRFERNLIVFRPDELHRFVNVGAHTAPETFAFKENAWFALGGGDARPTLPTPETGGRHGDDPGLDPKTLEQAAKSPLRAYGAEGLR